MSTGETNRIRTLLMALIEGEIDWSKPGAYPVDLPNGAKGTLIVGEYHTDDFYQRMIERGKAAEEVHSFHPQQEV